MKFPTLEELRAKFREQLVAMMGDAPFVHALADHFAECEYSLWVICDQVALDIPVDPMLIRLTPLT